MKTPAKLGRFRRQGWVIIDITVGLILVTLTGVALAVAMQAQQKGLQGLADSRAAARVAESTLISLSAGEVAPPLHDATVLVELLPMADEPKDFAWVKVHASVNHRTAELTGRAPRAVAERAVEGRK
jgi:hypothetical protein